MYASLVNFFAGAVLGIVVATIMSVSGEPGNWRRATEAPWWAWCGGLCGAVFVAGAAYAVPRLGVATVLTLGVASQLAAAIVIDHVGALGVAPRAVTLWRVAGILLVMVGTLLVRRG